MAEQRDVVEVPHLEGQRPGADDDRLDPDPFPLFDLVTDFLNRPDQPAPAPLFE